MWSNFSFLLLDMVFIVNRKQSSRLGKNKGGEEGEGGRLQCPFKVSYVYCFHFSASFSWITVVSIL